MLTHSSAMGPTPEQVDRDNRHWRATYIAIAAVFALFISVQLWTPLRLNGAGADIWQHLAAIHALAIAPFDPSNPFVDSKEASRLFGPQWFVWGLASNIFEFPALRAYVLAGIVNTGIWFAAVAYFGTRYFGHWKGAAALLLATIGGWAFPPSFTGYDSPLAIIAGAANPAFLLMSLSLFAWGFVIAYLQSGKVALLVWILIVTALGMACHPFGALVLMAGVGSFAIFGKPQDGVSRLYPLLAAFGGALISLAWPLYSPAVVLFSAGSKEWTTSLDFYEPTWLFMSLFPSLIGLWGLRSAAARPLLILALICSVGFVLGVSPQFAAGHRLLPVIVLLGQIGMAHLIIGLIGNRASRAALMVVASLFFIVQFTWTARIVGDLRRELSSRPSLYEDAQALAASLPSNAVVAGAGFASFPLAANGSKVLSTPFSEPLVSDMNERQKVSRDLFSRDLPVANRRMIAEKHGVAYLLVDKGSEPPGAAAAADEIAGLIRIQGRLALYRVDK